MLALLDFRRLPHSFLFIDFYDTQPPSATDYIPSCASPPSLLLRLSQSPLLPRSRTTSNSESLVCSTPSAPLIMCAAMPDHSMTKSCMLVRG